MSRRVLGLEISNTAVAGAVINSGIKGSFVDSHARIMLAGAQDFGPNLHGALERLCGQIDIAGTTCIASLPADRVSFRHLSLPFRDEKKLRQILPYEMEPLLPYPIEDLVVDYFPAGPGRGDNSDLIAAAVKKTTIEALLATLLPFGIDPTTLTVGGFAAAVCLAGTAEQDSDWVLADVDGWDLSLFFARAGMLTYTRSTRPPEFNHDPDGDGVARQINRSLLAYRDTLRPDFKPAALFIGNHDFIRITDTASAAALNNLAVQRIDLSRKTGLPSMAADGHPAAIYPDDNALALGYLEWAGLKRLDFRRGPFEKKKQWRQHRGHILRSGLLALLGLVLAFVNVMADNYALDRKISRLDHKIGAVFKTALPDVKRIVDPLQQMRVAFQAAERHLVLPRETGARLRVIDLLQELSTRIPDRADVEMTRVVIGRDSILISGNTDTFNSVDDIKSGLEQANAFRQVTIASANLEKSGQRINFKLKVQL